MSDLTDIHLVQLGTFVAFLLMASGIAGLLVTAIWWFIVTTEIGPIQKIATISFLSMLAGVTGLVITGIVLSRYEDSER